MTEDNQATQELHRLAKGLRRALAIHKYLFLYFAEPDPSGKQFLPVIPDTDGDLDEHFATISDAIDGDMNPEEGQPTKVGIFDMVLILSEELDLRAHEADERIEELIPTDEGERWVPRVNLESEACVFLGRSYSQIMGACFALRGVNTRRACMLADSVEDVATPRDRIEWAPGLVAWSYVHELDKVLSSFELLGVRSSAALDTPGYDPYVWVRQTDILDALESLAANTHEDRDLSDPDLTLDRGTLSRAVSQGELVSNGMLRKESRVNTASFLAWFKGRVEERRRRRLKREECDDDPALTQDDIDEIHARILMQVIRRARQLDRQI